MTNKLEEPCEYYELGICDGHADKFQDRRFNKCKQCTNPMPNEETTK